VRIFTSGSEKKTTENLYLTVEMVRYCASIWVSAQCLPPSTRSILYQEAVENILYHQNHNRQARFYHTKKTLQQLRNMGIEVAKLPCCIPRNS